MQYRRDIRIEGMTEAAERFIDEWFSGSRFIKAHTSGSTGRPKEIMLLKADMVVSARNTNRFFGIDSESVMLCPLSTDYIAGKMMIVRAIESGCRLILEKPSNNPACADYGRIDLIPIVPSQCDGLLASPFLKQIGNIIVGGAPLSARQEREVIASGCLAYATYGMTETCSHVAVRRLGEQRYKGMPGIEFSLDKRGCLVINAPDYSFKSLVTNDIVDLISPYSFVWKGRFDNAINSGGVKILPEEVEMKLTPVMGGQVIITSKEDEKWGECVVMLVALDNEKTEAELLALCKKVLPPYWVPKSVVRVESLPLTANGKIDRKGARELAEG